MGVINYFIFFFLVKTANSNKNMQDERYHFLLHTKLQFFFERFAMVISQSQQKSIYSQK